MFYYFKIYRAGEGTQAENLFILENKDESLAPEILESFQRQFDEAVAFINEQPEAALGWAVAGNIKKAVNDYAGAEALYLAGLKNSPKSDVLNSNLADLYYHFIEDYPRAETYYLAAIALNPSALNNYLELSVMYRVRFQDNDKAINILKEGLEKNPQNQQLMVTLANLYKKLGMTAEAKAAWEEIIELYPDNPAYRKELETMQ